MQISGAGAVKIRQGAGGIHFFNRENGINVLLDGIDVPRHLWSAAPRQVSIALTNRCDLRCPYCYAPKNGSLLEASAIIGWLHELDANGCLGIGFGGGEPTLFPGFAALGQMGAEQTRVAITFTTHGHKLDSVLCQELRGNVHFIRVSMDGVGTTYEELRGRSFSALRKKLYLIRSVAALGINYVVNARTLPHLDAAVSAAADSGAKEFLLLPESPVRGVGGIDPETRTELQKWVWEYKGIVPLTISAAATEGMPTSCPVPGETGLSEYAHVDASGFLRPSSFEETGVLIGSEGIIRGLETLRSQLQRCCQ
jgi:MoaA/NifB/PqqE/SkfB family radical SAM enzyme